MSNVTQTITGTVASGLGEGSVFTQLDWVSQEFESKLGYTPFPGTFNLVIDSVEWLEIRRLLMSLPGIKIDPPEGFCGAKCFSVKLDNDIQGTVIFPEVSDYPFDKFEILAPVAVREALKVENGDAIKVHLEI